MCKDNIGYRIKKRREELGMSQDELAKKVGYTSRSSINKIELGINDVRQKMIVVFAKALDTDIGYLMGWEIEHMVYASDGTQERIDKYVPEETRETFKRMLLYYMRLCDVTQNELAKKVGVSQAAVSEWCLGRKLPRIDKIETLAKVFGVEKSVFLTEDGQEKYYINKDASDMAEWLHQNPEYRVLFDASKKVKKEDIEKVKAMIDLMSDNKDDY